MGLDLVRGSRPNCVGASPTLDRGADSDCMHFTDLSRMSSA